MKRIVFFLVLSFCFSSVAIGAATTVDDLMKGIGAPAKGGGADEKTTAKGLKEALAVGTENAVKNVSRVDGYFGNQMIKILMPEKIRKVADVLEKVGYKQQVDDFVHSMNRAAEKAAPKAASIFGDAIREMTIDDAKKILTGGNTAATDFFKAKTHERIYGAFKPDVGSAMNEVGVTRSYKEMMSKYESIPFMSKESVDLDHYVTTKAMDGLYYMIGQEEKKIRTDPAARVTDLLKTVFGK
ncbi:MAG TPA: DUF4197 domain-containing protein [Thermodesulfovibrionales bacterium]|nr:DUF4197 domain-containing protein [Thermodesulfovibrionales bacterium]